MRSAYKYDLPVFLIQNINQRGEIVTEKSKYRKVDLIKFIDDCSYDKHLIFTSSEGGKNDYELPEKWVCLCEFCCKEYGGVELW